MVVQKEKVHRTSRLEEFLFSNKEILYMYISKSLYVCTIVTH